MRITCLIFASSTLITLTSCGDNLGGPDARPGDGDGIIPAAPRLGMQIDRMGRPAVAAALIELRDGDPGPGRDAYNAASDPATWATTPAAGRTIRDEIAANLAIFDVLDQGSTIPGTPGCGNQLHFNGNPSGGGTPAATSYHTLAGILSDDMLYVDTAKTTCDAYLALEIEVASGSTIMHSQCGGRTPKLDVIDVTYSALVAGIAGFTPPPALQPNIKDNVDAHADFTDTFPYFGPPR